MGEPEKQICRPDSTEKLGSANTQLNMKLSTDTEMSNDVALIRSHCIILTVKHWLLEDETKLAVLLSSIPGWAGYGPLIASIHTRKDSVTT